jgi:SAM-dependent methyltransferase
LPEGENYSDNFGFQWNKHWRTQYDSYSGAPVSERRYFDETAWGRELAGQLVLEAGSGSGRFTEQAVKTGATVVSFDYSSAVEANSRNNLRFDNLLIVQASIYAMPFAPESFDKVFCIGVIQHTPDPSRSFRCLDSVVKPGGSLVVDAYPILPLWKHIFLTKYWVLPLTNRIPSNLLYRICECWVKMLWGLTGLAHRLTGRRFLSWMLLVADYRGVYPLSDEMHREWSILDTFDMLSPRYDFPQTIASVRAWYENARYGAVEVFEGFNGITGRGVKR